MYVVTFYSFKGGVGRSMAMVNVGMELASSGRRVLLVDFDLEAPGLETFSLLKPKEKTDGLVDYINYYLINNEAPNINGYIYSCKQTDCENENLWVMPSGKQDLGYTSRFQNINWADLYEKHDGYLMFEDMKAQWDKFYGFDYVFIDSRTGHTDIGGICTRQLPDAVVILFFPNEQNLRGLIKIVSDIRDEANEPRGKNIQLHFVTSNVPDLDDEDHILESRMNSFRNLLLFDELAATIHHYDSLALLNQMVFTAKRPRSRLAQEYRNLAKDIVRYNNEDREGVIEYLKRIELGMARELQPGDDTDTRLDTIASLHGKDGEILYLIGNIKETFGDISEASQYYSKSLDAGYNDPKLLLGKIRTLEYSTEKEDISEYINNLFSRNNVSFVVLNRAIKYLARHEKVKELEYATTSTAVNALNIAERMGLAKSIGYVPWKAVCNFKKIIMENVIRDPNVKSTERDNAKDYLCLTLIAMGNFIEAMNIITKERNELFELAIDKVFNYGMAEWGLNGSPSKDIFLKVIELDKSIANRYELANYYQCIAIASWVIGDYKYAEENVIKSKNLINQRQIRLFSAWRYREVGRQLFINDLDSIKHLIDGGHVTPRFISKKGI